MGNFGKSCKKNKSKRKKNKTTANSNISQREPRVNYEKRKGTSGATGQLYESRLLSLVLLRCLTDDEVEDFLLGSNVDEIGLFDDICLRFTYKNKPVAAFIQTKHKDNAWKQFDVSSLYNPKSKVNLLKCFDSYLQVLNKFETDNSHIFNGDFKDLTFHFVVYTSAAVKVNERSKEKIKRIDEENNDTFVKVKQIIRCKDDDPNSGDIFQLAYDDQDVDLLSNVLIDKEIDLITQNFVRVIDKKGKKNYDIFKKHAGILVPDVITLKENKGYYAASVNPNFFYVTDEILIKLKYKIYEEILSKAQVDAQYLLTNLQSLLNSKTESNRLTYLSRLIVKVIVFDKGSNKLIFNAKVKEDVVQDYSKRLEQLQVSEVLVKEAIEEAGRKLLEAVQFKLTKHEYIDINEIEECSDKKSLFTNEINFAKNFLSTFYLYTNQGQEKDVAEKLDKKIAQYYKQSENSTNKSIIRADVASLKFHDKVQKWWLLDGNSYFLTKTCDYLKRLAFEIAQPFVDMLNFCYQHEIDYCFLKFLPQAMDFLRQISENKTTNIITCSLLLTTLKLKQFFGGNSMFIDYKHLYKVRENEWELLKEELKIKTNIVLILVCDKIQECEKRVAMWLIENIVDAFEGKIVIASKETICKITNNRVEINHTIVDEHNTLSDMATETQNKLLEYEVDFQGCKVKLRDLIDTDYSIINSEIVFKIVNNETITIGHNLSDIKYEGIEDYYLPRTFCDVIEVVEYDNGDDDNDDNIDDYNVTGDGDNFDIKYHDYKLDTFKDMPRNINIITGEAGIGKSTVLTHLSIETKKEYPQKWIIRIDLIDYCDEFEKLGTEVNRTEFMKLILMSQFEDINKFSIKEVGDNVLVEYTGNDDVEAFSLRILMNCYSKGDMIFIFDGFDEICPDYQTQVTNFIKHVAYDHLIEDDRYNSSLHLNELFYPSETNRLQIWITSRPYDFILQHLEKEFGRSLVLKPLTTREQNIFYDKYWNVNFKAQEVNMIQFNKIQTFFDFMGQFPHDLRLTDHFLATDVPVYRMYMSAVRFFRNQILYMPLNIDKEKVIESWVSDASLTMKLAQSNFIQGLQNQYTSAERVVGVPLYMDMTASYFVANINSDSQKSQTDWDFGYNFLNSSKKFVELILKIQFEDKCGMKISKPDVKSMFNDEHARFVSIYKKLAFYSIFHRSKYLDKLLTEQDRVDVEKAIQKMKDGKENSLLLERIHNDVPRFIYLTFAEFFAVEFIVDIILSKPQLINTTMDLILNFLMRQSSVGLLIIFDKNLKHGETKLKEVLEQDSVKKVVFDLIWGYKDCRKDVKVELVGDFEEFESLDIVLTDTVLYRPIEKNLPNVAMFLLRSINGNLNKDNIETFIKEILGASFFYKSMIFKHPELVDYALNMIREVDVAYIKTVIDICELKFQETDVKNIINKDILDALEAKVEYKIRLQYYLFSILMETINFEN